MNRNCPGLSPPSDQRRWVAGSGTGSGGGAWLHRGILEAECGDQLPGVEMRQGFDDIPVLFPSRSDDGSEVGEVAGALHRAETA